VSPSRERLSALLGSGSDFALCLGYAGWGPGQLDRELADGSWVHLEPDAAILFDTPISDRYDRALAQLGINVATLWMTPVNE
jgi:putative transcriptional regulator